MIKKRNTVIIKLKEEELERITSGMIVYDNGKYWVFKDNTDLYYQYPYYDHESAMERAERYGYSSSLYTREEFRSQFGDAACFY